MLCESDDGCIYAHFIFFQVEQISETTSGAERDSLVTDLQDDSSTNGLQSSANDNIFAEELHQKLNPGSEISILDVLIMVVQLSIRHNLSYVCTTDILKLINIVLDKNELPISDYMLKKIFAMQDVPHLYHFFCQQCFSVLLSVNSTDLQKNEMKTVDCKNCSSKNCNARDLHISNYFITISVKDQLKLILENSQKRSMLSFTGLKHKNGADNNDNQKISDIKDGSEYQRLSALAKDSYLSVNMNTDGVPLYFASKCSVWPIQLTINEMDPRTRFRPSNMLLAGIWCSNSEPKMEIYMKNFITEMRDLWENGVQWFNDTSQRQEYTKVFCLSCCVDSVARPMLQKVVQFNGYFGCGMCKHPGTRVMGQIRYCILQEATDLRNNVEMRHQMMQKTSEEGIKGISPFIGLPYFDLSCGFPVDPMHNVFLGVSRMLAHLWTDSSSHDKDYYIKAYIPIINDRLSQIKLPKSACRLTRPISDMKFWKASEWRNWLLFCSFPVLSDLLPRRFLEHYALLITAIYILLKENVTGNDLNNATRLLENFVVEFQILYGEINMVFNIHLLTHLSKCVSMFGPLWNFSLFNYESCNGHLIKLCKGTVAAANQIACRFLRLQRINHLVEKDFVHNTVSKFGNELFGFVPIKKVWQLDGIVLIETPSYYHEFTVEEMDALQNAGIHGRKKATGYYKFIKNGMRFYSNQYIKVKRSNDTVIHFKGGYGIIVGIYTVQDFDSILIFAQKINLLFDNLPMADNWFGKVHHIKPCTLTKTLCVLTPVAIQEKCIALQFDDKFYISVFPNIYDVRD